MELFEKKNPVGGTVAYRHERFQIFRHLRKILRRIGLTAIGLYGVRSFFNVLESLPYITQFVRIVF